MRTILLLATFVLNLNFAEAKRQRYCQIQNDVVPVTIGKKKEGITLFHLVKGDFYYCDPDEKAKPVQEQPLNGVYNYDRPGAIYAHTSVTEGSTSHFFNEPQEVFLEGDPGQVISVLSEPGKTYKDNQRAKGKLGRAWPVVASKKDRIFILGVDYRWTVDVYGEEILVKSAKVAVVRNDPKALAEFHAGEYSENDNEIKRKKTGIRIGWIDQKYIRSTEFEEQYQVQEDAPCSDCSPVDTPDTKKQLEDMRDPVEKLKKDQVLKHLDDEKCFGNRRDTNPNSELAKMSGLTLGMQKFLRRHPVPGDSRFSSQLSTDQLTTIRLLAYTMWGEMRSCPSRYQKAVARIALNRARELQEDGFVPKVKTCSPPPGKGKKSEYFPNQNLSTNLACVIGQNHQFTMWDGNDPNYKRIKCIKSDEKEWQKALSMAYDIVTEEADFNRETEQLKDVMFYSSAVGIPGLQEIRRSFSTPEGDLNSKKCTRFWRDNS